MECASSQKSGAGGSDASQQRPGQQIDGVILNGVAVADDLVLLEQPHIRSASSDAAQQGLGQQIDGVIFDGVAVADDLILLEQLHK